MGTATFLHFRTFRNVSLLLLILFLVYSIFSIITNVLAASNGTIKISDIDYLKISLGSKQNNISDTNNLYYYVQCWLGLAVVTIWLIVFQAIKYHEFKDISEYDNDTSSASDFTVVIEGIPDNATQEQFQKQLDIYHKHIRISNEPPFKIAKYNVARSFYLAESSLKDD